MSRLVCVSTSKMIDLRSCSSDSDQCSAKRVDRGSESTSVRVGVFEMVEALARVARAEVHELPAEILEL